MMDSITYSVIKNWPLFATGLLLGVFLFKRIELFVKLRHIKGPFLSRISGIPHILALLGPASHDWYHGLNKEYGDLVVVSPTMLLTSSPELWSRMNTHPGYTKSKWYYRVFRMDWRGDNIITQLDNAKHDERRKQMSRGYSGADNLTLEADIEACVVKLLRLLRTKYAPQRKPIDWSQKISYFTFDVISTIGFGKCYNLLNRDEDPYEYVASSSTGLKGINLQMSLGTWWLNYIPFFRPKISTDLGASWGFYRLLALNATLVEAREKEFKERNANEPEPRPDMLTSFMKNGIFGDDLKRENIVQIVAGTETTSNAIKGVCFYVMTNPRVYKALQKEIRDAVESGMAPQAPGIIKSAQAKELVYLQAVIKEGIRVYSGVNNQLSRDTPPEGDTVILEGGRQVYIPGGICIIPSFKAMHRTESVYGPDADIFRPERWIEEEDEEKLKAMRHEHNITFGHGRWQCLGKTIALRELGIVIFELFRHFDLWLVNPEKPWKAANILGARSTTDMWIQIEERKGL